MRHLKTFENTNINKTVYLCSIVQKHQEHHMSDNYVFDTTEDRDNFIINFIHADFIEAGDTSIEYIFDILTLIDLFNEGDETIYLAECEYITNVKLDPNILIKKDATIYNL